LIRQHGIGGCKQILGRLSFCYIPLHANLLSFLKKMSAPVNGKNQDVRSGTTFANCASRIQAIHHGHGDVQNHQVGVKRLGLVYGFLSIGGFTADLEIGPGCKGGTNPPSDQLLIVSN